MGEQIVLLKIELDPAIASVFQHALAPRFNMDLIPDPRRRGIDTDYNTHLAQESNRETDKADSFADDNSTATLAEFESLNKLKEITVEFSSFSGLQSNADKTTLLKIGTADPLSNEILNLGFNIVDEVTLLGLNVNRDLSSLTAYFDDIAGKVSRMVEHRERFNLSLPGRISICKTFMLSQIGYLGSILTPSNQQINRLQQLMDDFCLGTLRVARKKLYIPPSEGGLGLICLKEYITSIQCAWIKRVTQHWGDNWRYDLKLACYGNPLIADRNTFDRNAHPILYNICESFGKFRAAFTSKDDNYKKSFIFKNPFFRRGRNDNGILCENFFGARGNHALCTKLASLKFENFFVRGGPKSLAELNNDYDLNFSLVTYMRLHEALGFASNNRRDNIDKPSISLEFFVKSFDKGSKPFRRILSHNGLKKLKIESLNTVEKFFEITRTPKPEKDVIHACWGEWQKTFYGNRMREFLYKYRNNILGTNQRVSKFVVDHAPECTFCIFGKEPLPVHAESFNHLFFECAYSSRYREAVVNKFFPELRNANEDVMRTFWFTGLMPGMRKSNIFISSVVSVVNYNIWVLKLKKELNPVGIFIEDTVCMINRILKLSMKLREVKQSTNFHVCRHTFDPP